MAHTRVAVHPLACLRTLITAGGKHCPLHSHTQHPQERKPKLCTRNTQFTDPKRAQTRIVYTQHPIHKSEESANQNCVYVTPNSQIPKNTHTQTGTHKRWWVEVKSSREVGRVGIIKELWMRMGLKTGLNHIRRRHKDKFKAPDITNLNEQLSLLGLKIHPVTADGNCFYRAVADQLEGNEEAHGKYRHLAVDYIQIRSDAQAASLIGRCLCLSTPVCWGLQKFLESSELVSECMQDHREEFEPFVEDEVPFDEYCKTMRDDGTWAGHMELQATSLVTHHNICIHQLMTPRWQILNFESADACTLHLSYHDGEHYNSVRRLDDFGIGPAQPITIEADATPTTEPPPPKDKVDDTYADTGESPLQAVMEVTGNTNVDQVQEVLYRVDGVPDAAVEVLLEEQSLSGNISPSHTWETSSNSSETSGDYSHYSPLRSSGSDEGESTTSQASSHLTDGTSPTPYHVTDVTSPNPYQVMDGTGMGSAYGSPLPFQGISKNSACPCGSGKKYKYCCGTSRAKSTLTLVSRAEELLTNKLKKPMSMLPKVHHHSGKPAPSPPPGPPPEVVDMGALCI